ncbi:hypothetical protein H6G93_20910 [Nostoc sp. FACHB-973]|nr:hypothetical protein [Nostoc sp. FACHB-973]
MRIDSHQAEAGVIQTVTPKEAKAVVLRFLQLFFQRKTLCSTVKTAVPTDISF